MTSSEEKAKELYDKYLVLVRGGNLNETYHTKAKQCAIIAVDEILHLSYFEELTRSEDDDLYRGYWMHVKDAIGKL